MVQGWSFGSFHLLAPVATKSCGTFFAFMYLWIAVLGGVPSPLKTQQHLFLLDQSARHLDGLRRAVAVVEAEKSILRPFTPPSWLIFLKYAASTRPMVP